MLRVSKFSMCLSDLQKIKQSASLFVQFFVEFYLRATGLIIFGEHFSKYFFTKCINCFATRIRAWVI